MATHAKRSVDDEVPVRAAHDRRTGLRRPRVLSDPASGVLTGYPGGRIGHTETGAQGTDDDASGVLTGYPGKRTDSHLHAGTRGLDDPAAGVLTGYPGARVDHTRAGGQSADDPAAGVLTGYPLSTTHGPVDTATPGTDAGAGRP